MTISKGLTVEHREMLIQRVLDAYQADPGRIRNALPEVAGLLDGLTSPPARRDNVSPFGLTQRERNFHREALRKCLKKIRSLTAEEAIQGLEHGAILLHDNRDRSEPMNRERDELLKLARKATGIRPRKTGESTETVVGEGSPSRIVPVVRGIDLHLTWEFKLVKVTLDPEQWRLRCQAVSIVGIGSALEVAADVAENHDEYFVEATENA